MEHIFSSSEIQPAIDRVSASGGGVIHLEPGIYPIRESLILKSGVLLKGESLPAFSQGTTLQRTADVPMLIAPGWTTSWGLEDLKLDGNAYVNPILRADEADHAGDIRGNFQVNLSRLTFTNSAAAAIHATNAWDWWIDRCDFGDCGRVNSPNLDETGAVYILNSRLGSPSGSLGSFSNDWHIRDCTGNLSTGRFLVSDFDPIASPNFNLFVTHCAFEGDATTQAEAVYGVFAHSLFSGNYFAGVTEVGSRHLMHLLNPGGVCQGNRIIGNNLRLPGGYGIYSEDWIDLIANNLFFGGRTDAHIMLAAPSYRIRVIGNHDYGGIVPTVKDLGNSNLVS